MVARHIVKLLVIPLDGCPEITLVINRSACLPVRKINAFISNDLPSSLFTFDQIQVFSLCHVFVRGAKLQELCTLN